ncbi:hypothetical protein GCM10011611_10030 [Aliidongia dinghuensis]|uniref:DUF2927 domain-containing protein n=2 Tax=Aliidongia dinghuensis TaxID=1867774 RepID=A0A8J2YQB9_9PROT|nr:hypothetical protein GCM10011611_10030 [Aliidongia dinghuensis]
MKNRRLSIRHAALSLLLAMPVPAHAQALAFGGSPGSFANFNFPIISPQLSRNILQRAAGPDKAVHSARGTTVDLTVGNDPAVSARARQAFLDDIHRGASNGLTRQIELSLQQQDVRSQFGLAISPYGLHLNDLADVTAAYYVAMWMAANQAPPPTKPQVQAVGGQLHEVLAEQGIHLDPVQRQLGAEEIMYKTVWLIHLRQEAERLADQRARQQLADVVWQAFKRQQNVDLRATLLTDAGLVGRP